MLNTVLAISLKKNQNWKFRRYRKLRDTMKLTSLSIPRSSSLLIAPKYRVTYNEVVTSLPLRRSRISLPLALCSRILIQLKLKFPLCLVKFCTFLISTRSFTDNINRYTIFFYYIYYDTRVFRWVKFLQSLYLHQIESFLLNAEEQ